MFPNRVFQSKKPFSNHISVASYTIDVIYVDSARPLVKKTACKIFKINWQEVCNNLGQYRLQPPTKRVGKAENERLDFNNIK